ncbi:MAG TPA: 30S ribosomal protein S17 [Candidatus Paceibacterota bacterium]|nr:30S ribosomal protein S17 [Candidatus Paceibacterota bacterium]
MKTEIKNKKVLKGKVVSDKMAKTVVVEIKRFVKHPKYGKFYNISKRYKAHDEGNKAKIGDEVEIRECRPMSKDKHFEVINLPTQTSK